MRIKSTDCFFIAGQRESGKSNLCKYLITQLLQAKIKVIIIDPMGEYGTFKNKAEIYVPRTMQIQEVDHIFNKVWIYGNCFLIMDEAEMYLPNEHELSGSIFRCFIQGRHHGIGIGLTGKRFALINKTAVSQSKHFFLFPIFLPNDVNYVKQFVAEESLSKLSGLADYSYIYFDSRTKSTQVFSPCPLL